MVELIEEFGIGCMIRSRQESEAVAADRAAIARATDACLVHRDRFSHEHQGERVAPFFEDVLAVRAGHCAVAGSTAFDVAGVYP